MALRLRGWLGPLIVIAPMNHTPGAILIVERDREHRLALIKAVSSCHYWSASQTRGATRGGLLLECRATVMESWAQARRVVLSPSAIFPPRDILKSDRLGGRTSP